MKLASAAIAALLAAPALGQTSTTYPPAATAPAATAPAATTFDGGGAPLRQSNEVSDQAGRSPMGMVATNALYGGAAGLIVGTGIALIEQGHWGRDLMIGAGVGVVTGAIVGGVQAYNRSDLGDRVALDGLGTPERDKDKQRPMTSVGSVAMHW